MSSLVKASFVIPLYNHFEASKIMLGSLQRTIPSSLSHEIILIDDASRDHTPQWLLTVAGPNIVKLSNNVNSGYAASNNLAVAKAKGEILCLLNNDLILEPGWFEPMLAVLENPTLRAGVVGNVQFAVTDRSVDHAGVKLNFLGQFEHIKTLQSLSDAHKVLGVTGACMMVRKTDFIRLGGFDESFVNGGEDVDFCYSIRKAGMKVYVAGQSRIQHHVSLSRSQVKKRDEINSRLLQIKRRSMIKSDLADAWYGLLAGSQLDELPFIDGRLLSEFVVTPRTAALLIAENMLRRNEYYWLRELDATREGKYQEIDVTALGLQQGYLHGLILAARECRFRIEGLFSARNFFVCGKYAGSSPALTVALIVNNIQVKDHVVHSGQHFNLGITDPLLMPQGTNVFVVRIDAAPADTKGFEISHIVVDDQPIRKFNLHNSQ